MVCSGSLIAVTSSGSYSGVSCGIGCAGAAKAVILLQYRVMIAEQRSDVRVSFKFTSLSPCAVWLGKYDSQCGITFLMRVFLTNELHNAGIAITGLRERTGGSATVSPLTAL